MKGVVRVALGGSFSSPGVQQILNRRVMSAQQRGVATTGLTEIESEIVRGIAGGLTAREVAETLELRPRTIENYQSAKLWLSGPNALLHYALTKVSATVRRPRM